MRIVVAIVAVVVTSSARADTIVLDAGLGAPGGITAGIGVRTPSWEAGASGGGVAMAFVGMLSASVHVHGDLAQWRNNSIALGVAATHLGYIMGSDTVVEGTVDTVGPTLRWRHALRSTVDMVIDAGPLIGRCRGYCDMTYFVMPELTLRFAWKM